MVGSLLGPRLLQRRHALLDSVMRWRELQAICSREWFEPHQRAQRLRHSVEPVHRLQARQRAAARERVELGLQRVHQRRGRRGVGVPHRIRARLGDGGVVELEYSRIWRAVQLTATAFQIDPPSEVRVVGMDLDEADAGNP